MKAHKLTISVLDFDEVGIDLIVDYIENAKYPNHCIAPQVLRRESRDIGEWTDEHPLNQGGYDKEKNRPRWMIEF